MLKIAHHGKRRRTCQGNGTVQESFRHRLQAEAACPRRYHLPIPTQAGADATNVIRHTSGGHSGQVARSTPQKGWNRGQL